ncbi:hypothetical protein E2C01_031143 [Portunus trituberculatus]|uniref:Uncharacterized protein n=1 Tax=Portunus trituberculatus TaxID=210409 RepID=A0A5B7EWV3_PORTR|nr:hypothetical protein [Portunus trituberculatus]
MGDNISAHPGRDASDWVEAGERGGLLPPVFSWVMTASRWPSLPGGGPPKPPAAAGPCRNNKSDYAYNSGEK